MENIKFNIVASQAKSIYFYKNTRSKLLNCWANVYFNRLNGCVRLLHIVP